MATRSNNQGRTGGPDRTSNEGRKAASGGSEKVPAKTGVSSGGGGSTGANTSRGGGSSRTAASKGGAKAPKKSSVPSQKGK
jgi:hypothetical protein